MLVSRSAATNSTARRGVVKHTVPSSASLAPGAVATTVQTAVSRNNALHSVVNVARFQSIARMPWPIHKTGLV